MPFYKRDGEALLTANAIHAPGYELTEENKPTEAVDGWMWFDTLEAAAKVLTAVSSTGVPQSVTMRQARIALLGAGLLPTVNAAIANMTGIEGEAARIEWEYSQEVHRNRGLVQALGGALGMTGEQLDALFIAAAQIQ